MHFEKMAVLSTFLKFLKWQTDGKWRPDSSPLGVARKPWRGSPSGPPRTTRELSSVAGRIASKMLTRIAPHVQETTKDEQEAKRYEATSRWVAFVRTYRCPAAESSTPASGVVSRVLRPRRRAWRSASGFRREPLRSFPLHTNSSHQRRRCRLHTE